MAKRTKKARGGSRTLVVVRDQNGKLVNATTRPERQPEPVYVSWSKRPIHA